MFVLYKLKMDIKQKKDAKTEAFFTSTVAKMILAGCDFYYILQACSSVCMT